MRDLQLFKETPVYHVDNCEGVSLRDLGFSRELFGGGMNDLLFMSTLWEILPAT